MLPLSDETSSVARLTTVRPHPGLHRRHLLRETDAPHDSSGAEAQHILRDKSQIGFILSDFGSVLPGSRRLNLSPATF